jgi:16S rRNA (uracil1498-N3)-methyltransferase
MRQTRVFTQLELAAHVEIDLDSPAAHYLARVLRLTVGAPVTLFNGDGLDYPGIIVGIDNKRVSVTLEAGRDPGNESNLHITLVQGISRGERMDYCLQKATELGVSRIQLLISERSEVHLKAGRMEKRLAHWRSVIQSACEQSGRARVPELAPPLSLSEVMRSVRVGRTLVLTPQASAPLATLAATSGPFRLLVGPEGGLSPEEISTACSLGAEQVSLGPRVLRTETAGPVAIAVLQSLWGDFR